jgi:hypothetical protein
MNFFFKNILGTDKLKLEKYTEYIGNLTKEKVKLEELQKKYPDIAWIKEEKDKLIEFIKKSNKPQEDVKPTTLDPITQDSATPDSATPDSATSASKTSKSELETPDSLHAQTTGGTRKKRKNKKRKKHKKKTFKY